MEAIANGIELTGTLYTSAQGAAKDKLAMAQQIYDNELNEFQSDINKKVEALDGNTISPTDVDSKIAAAVKTNVTDKLGTASGIATLGADSKLTAAQLPTLKTINGNSIIGSGNIVLDLSIYTIVTELPATGANNKIYLVLTPGGGETGDLYSEYAYINNKWEKFGTYKAEVDLTPYVKFTDIASSSKAGVIKLGFTATGKKYPVLVEEGKAYVEVPWTNTTYSVVTTTANGLMIAADKVKLNGIATGATADSAITTAELEAILV